MQQTTTATPSPAWWAEQSAAWLVHGIAGRPELQASSIHLVSATSNTTHEILLPWLLLMQAYLPQVAGLPGGEGHAGRQLLPVLLLKR